MAHDEEVRLYGRRFIFRFTQTDAQRVEVEILDGAGPARRPYVRAPVRGRTEDEARERAREVLQNYAGLDRYLALVQRAATEAAPGARLAVDETALDVRVELTEGWRLSTPLILVREDALDPERTDEELLAFIRAHLAAYLQKQ